MVSGDPLRSMSAINIVQLLIPDAYKRMTHYAILSLFLTENDSIDPTLIYANIICDNSVQAIMTPVYAHIIFNQITQTSTAQSS